jgi:hypothetical protein
MTKRTTIYHRDTEDTENKSTGLKMNSSHRRRPVPMAGMGPGLRRDDQRAGHLISVFFVSPW